MARSRTAGPAMTSPAAMAAVSAPAAGGSSRSRKATAGCAGCRPASPPRAAAGSSPEDFAAAGYWQLSLAGMSRLGSTGPARQAPPDGPAPPAAASGWTQLQLSAPGESLHFDKRHWAASAITGPALEQARRIARNLAAARGWNDRIITETSRALAVVLAEPPARRHDRLVPAPGGPAPP